MNYPILILCVLYLFHQNKTCVAQNDTIRVACIGNSITEGISSAKNFPVQLNILLGNKWDVRNFGASGSTMLKKGDYPYWNTQKFKDALLFQPQKVIIELGTNDSKYFNWIYKNDFYSDYISMIDTFAHLASHPEIYIACPPKAFSDSFLVNDSILRNEIISVIYKVSKDKNVKMIDFYALTSDKPYLFYDGVHPNDDGISFIAKTWYDRFLADKFADEEKNRKFYLKHLMLHYRTKTNYCPCGWILNKKI